MTSSFQFTMKAAFCAVVLSAVLHLAENHHLGGLQDLGYKAPGGPQMLEYGDAAPDEIYIDVEPGQGGLQNLISALPNLSQDQLQGALLSLAQKFGLSADGAASGNGLLGLLQGFGKSFGLTPDKLQGFMTLLGQNLGGGGGGKNLLSSVLEKFGQLGKRGLQGQMSGQGKTYGSFGSSGGRGSSRGGMRRRKQKSDSDEE